MNPWSDVRPGCECMNSIADIGPHTTGEDVVPLVYLLRPMSE